MKQLRNFLQKPHVYIVIVLIGIGLKFYKIEEQFFWDDEIATILHVTGIPMDKYEEALPVNKIVSRDYYDDLLSINDEGYSLKEQITGLMRMPQLTPGHYYYLIFWTRIFGDNYMAYRYFSVFMFLIALPFLFFLTRKLCNSNIAAWIALILFSFSPYIQIYSQEARYGMLWISLLMFFQYSFLKLIESRSLKWWLAYALVGILAMHASALSFIMLLAHTIYYTLFYRHQWKPLFYSHVVIFLGCIPWLTYIYIHHSQIENALAWQTEESWVTRNPFFLLYEHLTGMAELFVNILRDTPLTESGGLNVFLNWMMIATIITSFVILYKKAEKKTFWFIGIIVFTGVLVISIVDMVRPSCISMMPRYHAFYYAGVFLAMSFTLFKISEKKPMVFAILFLILISLGTLSIVKNGNAPGYYKRMDCDFYAEDIPQYFSGDDKILIVSDFMVFSPYQYSGFLSFIHATDNENIDILYSKPDFPNFRELLNPKDYTNIYAMNCSSELIEELKKYFTTEELVLLKDRKYYNVFPIPFYQLKLQPEGGIQ